MEDPNDDWMAGDVDHALLESLFYNEFALLEATNEEEWGNPSSSSLETTEDPGKRKILVSQFATLAERLGITIPSEIIGKLQQPESPVEITQATTTKRTSHSTTAPRRRKKPRLHECQVKLAKLREENERLKRHLDVIQNRSQTLLKERAVTEDTMRSLMETGEYDKLPHIIDAYSETHSDYGKKRFEQLQFHLDQLRYLSNPTDFTKMGLWALGGNGKFKPRISNLLQTELEITDSQSRKILEQREKIRTVCANHQQCIVLLNKLQTLCHTKTKIFNDRMTKVRQLLSPKQTILLILWLKENTHTLRSVCPGWESEQKA